MRGRRRPGKPRRWLACCLLAGIGSAQAAVPQLRVADAAALTPVEREATQALFDAAVRRLPPRWAEALSPTIVAEWRDDLPARVHGRAKARRMLLNRSLLAEWIGESRADDPDGPAARAALRAVLHELAHFYDRTPQGRLSRDPRLLDLAGWQVSPMRLGLRTGRNRFTDRSPDRYELAGPVEFVAVNLEYFLLDPSYACRRPALHAYFQAHFGTAPPVAACARGMVYLDAPQAAADARALLQLDPERVHTVDYLFAEGNRRPMSRWGHSMLRLVICAPGRPRGPDCRLDLQHHRVLSFRAFVDDVQISSWRGLTGSYPSRLFVLPLEQVVEEYAKIELRGLQSLPLGLDREEIAALLERAAQLHWTYDGRYYFLSNNCAVETFKLLRDGVPRLGGERLSAITPTGLLRRLRRAGLVDAAVLDDRSEAMRLGYYFEPLSARYQAMFENALQAMPLAQTQVDEWLELSPELRAPWLRQADLRAGAALWLLEQAALRRQELQALDALKRRLLGRGRDASRQAAAFRELLQLEGQLSRPAALSPAAGYGLPQDQERDLLERESLRHGAHWARLRAALRAEARAWLPPPQRERLQATQANLDQLGERLRLLHRQQGGLQLRPGD